MTYRVSVAPQAARQLRKLDPPAAASRPRSIYSPTNPRPPATTQLVGGAGEWRVRTGDYRIIYDIRDDEPVVSSSYWPWGAAARSTDSTSIGAPVIPRL